MASNAIITKVGTVINTIIAFIEKLKPLVDLIPRLLMANVFWSSGILKLPAGFLGVGKGSWDSTLILFEYEHPVPGLPPEVAAFLGTGFEILCPILLILGLGARGAAVILLSMTAVIEFTYQHNDIHMFWAALLLLILVNGAGKLSLDNLIKTRFKAYINNIK